MTPKIRKMMQDESVLPDKLKEALLSDCVHDWDENPCKCFDCNFVADDYVWEMVNELQRLYKIIGRPDVKEDTQASN